MSDAKGIFWLASYPKSGNTWFRIFLANLLNPSAAPININELHTGEIASSRIWVDSILGFESAEFSHDEIDKLRRSAYQWHAEQLNEVGYHKIHDAYTYLERDKPLIPQEGCLGALYFIRNPLDVAISFANHSVCSIDQAINYMARSQYAFCKTTSRQHNQLRQQLLSWSQHVQSWTQAPQINVEVIRYEDMKLKPLATFTKAVSFLNLKASTADIEKALQHAQIEQLQQQEEQSGFRESPMNVKRFFRKGIVGDWQTSLSQEQITRIIHDHGEVMQEYGYLDEYKNPYFIQSA